MSTNETPNDYGLLDVTTSLCKNGRTGRLQINVGSTRGAFFFKDGQLVDARVGTLTGFAAVNLAVSSGATVLNFDSSIEPPASRFSKSNERRLLKTRFGIDVAEAEVQSAQGGGGEGRLSLVPDASAIPPSIEPPVRGEVPVSASSAAPLNGAGVVPSYASTQLKKATAPLKGGTSRFTPPPAATAPQRDASVSAQETIVPLNVASAPAKTITAALRDTVVPLRIAGSPSKPAIAALHETVVPLNGAGTPSQTTTASLRNVTAPLKDVSAIPRPDESANKAPTSPLSAAPLWLVSKQSKTNSLAVQKKLASVSQSLETLGKQSVSYVRKKTAVSAASIALIVRNNKTAGRVALIALIVIPVAVGSMSYWSKGKQTLPLEVSPPPAASSLRIPAVAPSTPAVAPSKTRSEDQSLTIKPLTKLPLEAVRVRHDFPSSSEAANSELPATGARANTTKTNSRETVADGTSDKKESGAAAVEPNQAPEEKQLVKPASRAIVVEVRVESGRVSEAFIKNRRPGLEGYEATALRLARQRRYPKETTTTETIVLQVNGEH